MNIQVINKSKQGDDYGTVGNEVLIPTERGRAYGIETMLRWHKYLNKLRLFGWKCEKNPPYIPFHQNTQAL